MSPRTLFAAALLAGCFGGLLALVGQGRLPPADFTFNNATEIESLDPAVVTGQPEGRIIWALYEGLVRPSPDDRRPTPGMAERWDISDDGLTYTFHLRRDAKWSNGDPVTADDFVYSMRRFLSPVTAAEYAYQAWYLKNAKRYSTGAGGLEVGDAVEVELYDRPPDALPFAQGQVVRGELVAVEEDEGVAAEDLADRGQYIEHRTFVVETGGKQRRFRVGDPEEVFEDAESCSLLTLDFGEVGIRAVDEHTVETVLDAPTPYWLELLGFYPLSPVNRRCIEEHGYPAWMETENIVTNGPFTLEFRRLRDRIRLRKNPDYWDADNVALETIDALSVQMLTTAFNLYETGGVDWIEKVPPLIARELAEADPPRDDYNPAAQLGTYFYAFNTTREPFNDVRVRRALVMALVRQEIIDTACAGEIPARSITPPGLRGYTPPNCEPYNLKEAARLLAEAGYPEGEGILPFTILYNTSDEHATIAQLVRKQWGDGLGVVANTRNEEWGTYLASQRQLSFDVMRRSWIGDYLDPNTFVDMFVTDGENNNTGWSNARYDELVEKAKYELDPEARLAMLHEAEGILMSEAPIMPIYYYVSRNLVRPEVRGFFNNLQDSHPLWSLRIDREATEPNEFMAPPPRGDRSDIP